MADFDFDRRVAQIGRAKAIRFFLGKLMVLLAILAVLTLAAWIGAAL